jgi:hypothetical protein
MRQNDIVLLKRKADELLKKGKILFDISHYPLFDNELALDSVGDEAAVRETCNLFYETTVEALIRVKALYEKKDWDKMQDLIDYMADSACFGAVRLYFSLLLLEKYLIAGYNQYKEALYTQIIEVWRDTLTELTTKGFLILSDPHKMGEVAN